MNHQSAKPHPDYPLTAHPSGRWCKKVKGRIHYFVPIADPQAALERWLKEKDGLPKEYQPSRRSPEYRAWRAMRNRCNNSNHLSYKHYGGRGISVCERWKSFHNFFADMGKRPNSAYSLDRINNNGDYRPDNCRWATRLTQARNRRRPQRRRNMTTSQAIEQLIEKAGLALELGIHLDDAEQAEPLQEAFDQVIEALKQEVQE